MCFGLAWSGVSFSVLVLTALAFPTDARVVAALVFLAAKEAIQFCNYLVAETCSPTNRALTTLSWIHISFQTILHQLVHFSILGTTRTLQAAARFYLSYSAWQTCCACESYGVALLPLPCADQNKRSSMCRKETCSTPGKYHLAYGFELESADSTILPSSFTYYLLTYVPALVIGDYAIVTIHAAVMGFSVLFARHDIGEAGALWCLNTFWIAGWVVLKAKGVF